MIIKGRSISGNLYEDNTGRIVRVERREGDIVEGVIVVPSRDWPMERPGDRWSRLLNTFEFYYTRYDY